MKNLLKILCFLFLTASAPSALAAERLAVTYIKPPMNVPSMVERRLGLYEKHCGMPVDYVALANGPDQVHALAAGDVSFLPAVGSTSVFLAAANGADFKILSVFARSPASFKILAAPDSPLNRPSDLRGKTVAGPRGTILHELLALWLARDGLTVRDVNFLNMNIPAAQAALAAGRVDAALLTGAPAWKMAADGWKVLRDGGGLVGGEVLTVTTGKTLRERPELVKKFMAARAESVEWIKTHRGEAAEIASRELGLTAEETEAQLPLYDFSPEITQADAEGLQRTVDFMAAQGMMSCSLNVKNLFAFPQSAED